MLMSSIRTLFAAAAAILCTACARDSVQDRKAEIGFLQVSQDITLRRLVARNPMPKGTVLFLHGFPETLQAWTGIASALADDYEVHAFDWPGYGLSSRPPVDRFAYAPRDYARVLDDYIAKAGIDTSRLTIYATDIGALPVLLLALEKPDIARRIIVGDFAPLNRPQYMYERLQALKAGTEEARIQANRNRDDTLENAYRRGLPKEAQFEIEPAFKNDMALGWNHGALTTADAFSYYYAQFTRDQDYLEARLSHLKTSVKVIWGEKDLYIRSEMGREFAEKINADFTLLAGIGHYPHLQNSLQTVDEIRNSFR